MKTRFFLVLLLLVPPFLVAGALMVQAPAKEPCRPTSIKEEVVDPYVQINTPKKHTGSGVVIRLKGELLVLTCAHMTDDAIGKEDTEGIQVVRPLTVLKVKGPKTLYKSEADIVQKGSVRGVDLALLRPRIKEGLRPALWDSSISLELGEECWYVGTPSGVHARLEKSLLSDIEFQIPDIKGTHVGVNGCGYFGSSGGPVFVLRNYHYYLCGIVSRAGPDIWENPKCILYAVDHMTIKKFLGRYQESK